MSRGQEDGSAERRDFGTLRLRGRMWWVRYRVDGRTYEESSHSSSPRAAEKLLGRRQAELGIGAFTAPDVKRTTFEDLARIIEDDYAVNGYRSTSTERLGNSFKQLRVAFAGARAATITLDRLTAYVRQRLDAEAAPGTVWNELKALKSAFRLAKRAGRVAHVPEFPQLADWDQVRTGFFEEADYRALTAELPAPLQPVIEFAYCTGWRIPSEVLPLTWARVDFGAGLVRLEVGTTKNSDGRTFPFAALPPLKALLERQRAHTERLERQTGQIIPWVFHRNGRQIRDYYRAWDAAIDRAAHTGTGPLRQVTRPQLLERIPHDFRRTAVRNLERAGVSRSVAMKLTGHKTEAVYRRYAIAPEQDLREGVEKLAELGRSARRGTIGGQRARAATGTHGTTGLPE